MKKDQIYSLQEWLPIEKILNKGIIKLKNNSYIKILKINPINYDLKSDMEKMAILNSYKTFLKTCNFNIQIIIQSDKKDLIQHISFLKEINQNQIHSNRIILFQNYIQFIQNINQEKKSSSKNFYIVLQKSNPNNKTSTYEEIIIQELNENYLKIKECLSKCGNYTSSIENKEELISLLKSFFHHN